MSRHIIIRMRPSRSLYEKYGWNGILSQFEFSPVGLFDPVSCRSRRCSRVIPRMANGIRK